MRYLILVLFFIFFGVSFCSGTIAGKTYIEHFESCINLTINITADNVIDNGEYIVNNSECKLIGTDYYECNCTDDYNVIMYFPITTINNYTIFYNLTYLFYDITYNTLYTNSVVSRNWLITSNGILLNNYFLDNITEELSLVKIPVDNITNNSDKINSSDVPSINIVDNDHFGIKLSGLIIVIFNFLFFMIFNFKLFNSRTDNYS